MQNFLKQFQDSMNPVQQSFPCPDFSNPNKHGARFMAWEPQEDSILVTAVKEKGPKNWSKIAKQINYETHNGIQLRKGKHCRERWFNHLNPELNSNSYLENEWNQDEDEVLWNLQKENGNSWSLIAKSLPGRTENSVRNRWNILCKKRRKDCKS
jgi:hypothetical protein